MEEKKIELPTEARKAEMVNEIKEHYGLFTHAAFARKLGITPQNAFVWIQRGTFNAELVAAVFPEISGDWLLTGKGEMLKANRFPESTTYCSQLGNETTELKKALDALAEEQRLTAKAQAQSDRIIELMHDLASALKRISPDDKNKETCK